MNFDELKDLLRQNGVVGAGGAGFPSYAKLDKRADTLILNCAECEPLLRLHRQVLEQHAEDILIALDLLAKAAEVTQVYIALKHSYKRAIEAVNAVLPSFPNMKVCTLPEIYPAGDEVVLTYEVTGRVVPPGAIPLAVGVTVFNVETVYNVYQATKGIPVTHKFVTIAGAVASPITLKVPIGMTLGELVPLAGGATVSDPVFWVGGPMMGRVGTAYEPVTKTTNAVLILPQDHYVVKKKQAKAPIDLARAMAACCQCSYCTDLCPRHLLGHPINPSEFMRVSSNGITGQTEPYLNSFFCSGCGLCEVFSCCQGLSPRNLLAVCKSSLRQKGVKPPQNVPLAPVSDVRKYRQIPVERLLARLDLTAYKHPAPLTDTEVSTKQVRLSLSQHIGAPSVPTVAVGDSVTVGQLIAAPATEALSVGLHSSVNGIVKDVTDTGIVITAN